MSEECCRACAYRRVAVVRSRDTGWLLGFTVGGPHPNDILVVCSGCGAIEWDGKMYAPVRTEETGKP